MMFFAHKASKEVRLNVRADMVVHFYNPTVIPATWEAESVGSSLEHCTGKVNEILLEITYKNKNAGGMAQELELLLNTY
jgi:hypothetical protein